MSEETEQTTDRVQAFANRFFASQLDQLETMYEQAEKLQKQGLEQSKEHLEQAVDLGTETLDYVQTLGREWREMQIETLKNLAGRDED